MKYNKKFFVIRWYKIYIYLLTIVSHNTIKFCVTLLHRFLFLVVLFLDGQKWLKVPYLTLKVVVRSLKVVFGGQI